MMRPPGSFNTERLVLRPPELEDAKALFDAYGSDPEATRFLTWVTNGAPEEMKGFLTRARQRQAEASEFYWVIEERSTTDSIGMISFQPEDKAVEIGYVLGRSNWGRGYATEAARAIVGWLIEQPDIYRVWAVCDVENHASARVLESAGCSKRAYSVDGSCIPTCHRSRETSIPTASSSDCFGFAELGTQLKDRSVRSGR